eukprot:TRINITY_DN6433_c0_g1_i1.p1 TRINITY_DN6433_c0_g1~~TRINITY_DN6433_c0_g1_i1.p1  ORF type:complete len:246 (+),score=72.34 TRINITY_DN6433_c0_g1_i1:29-766(+)
MFTRQILSTKSLLSQKKQHKRHYAGKKQKKVAVVFSGCGVYDGTEIQEAVFIMSALSQFGAQVGFYAPDMPQMHVIDHLTGEVVQETRNVLVETARITRGNVAALSGLDVDSYDAVILPGGFGAAKNLSSWATEGSKMTVNEDLERILKAFHEQKKPIGLSCIAPVIGAKVFPGCKVTIGNDEDTQKGIEDMGSKNVVRDVTDVEIDTENIIVSTPAYMYGNEPIHKVGEGLQRMVKNVLQLIKQ